MKIKNIISTVAIIFCVLGLITGCKKEKMTVTVVKGKVYNKDTNKELYNATVEILKVIPDYTGAQYIPIKETTTDKFGQYTIFFNAHYQTTYSIKPEKEGYNYYNSITGELTEEISNGKSQIINLGMFSYNEFIYKIKNIPPTYQNDTLDIKFKNLNSKNDSIEIIITNKTIKNDYGEVRDILPLTEQNRSIRIYWKSTSQGSINYGQDSIFFPMNESVTYYLEY